MSTEPNTTSLRDQLAIAVAAGLSTSLPPINNGLWPHDIVERLALAAYMIADQMLKVRAFSTENSTPLERREFSVRAQNVLDMAGIHTIEQLAKQTPTDLLRYRRCGKTTVNEIRRYLIARGANLSGPG